MKKVARVAKLRPANRNFFLVCFVIIYLSTLKIPQPGDVKSNQELAITVVILIVHVVHLRNDVLVVGEEQLKGVRTGIKLYP